MSSDRAAVVAFKDLCLDADDAAVAATFWSQALNLSATRRGRDYVLSDGVEEHTLWINQVPEPKVVKHRVHLDVHTASVADLTALGARVLDDSFRWTVLADPEGGEFCAFERPLEQLPSYRLYELVVDAADPQRLATWWARRLGVEPQRGSEIDEWSVQEARGMGWEMVFGRVPEPKTGKNRVHWDVYGVTAELLAVGATLLRAADDEVRWDVLTDPEGNEFCVFAR